MTSRIILLIFAVFMFSTQSLAEEREPFVVIHGIKLVDGTVRVVEGRQMFSGVLFEDYRSSEVTLQKGTQVFFDEDKDNLRGTLAPWSQITGPSNAPFRGETSYAREYLGRNIWKICGTLPDNILIRLEKSENLINFRVDRLILKGGSQACWQKKCSSDYWGGCSTSLLSGALAFDAKVYGRAFKANGEIQFDLDGNIL